MVSSECGHSDVVTILLRNGAGVDMANNVSDLMISTSVSTCLITLTTIVALNSNNCFYCLISLVTIFISTHVMPLSQCKNIDGYSCDRQTDRQTN